LFVARGLCCAAALEGALKLKELSYLHAEGYAAGELKHGPIALIEPGFPVIAIVCRDQLRPKMLSQLAEVAARGAEVIVVAEEHDEQARAAASLMIPVPDGCTSGLLAPVITVIPLQLLAGLVAGALGRDIDRPRNLAKSVTVI
jgi:glucosamine--fructose-6-phosphate aminotransferase (isomerizing)